MSKTLVAMYDATPEAEQLSSPDHALRARALGAALAELGLGIVARPGSPLVLSALNGHAGRGAATLALSPASSFHEHTHAYRLPTGDHTVIYTGRGALGADLAALASAQGMAVIGSHEAMLKNILAYAREHRLPIAILTHETPASVHERIHAEHASLTEDLIISHDPVTLVHDLAMRLRRRALGTRS